MLISQRCQYALRAVFELAKQRGRGPDQDRRHRRRPGDSPTLPRRHPQPTETGGFCGVQTRFGRRVSPRPIARKPDRGTDSFASSRGPSDRSSASSASATDRCPLRGSCVFQSMWEEARHAMEEVYDKTTFADLLGP